MIQLGFLPGKGRLLGLQGRALGRKFLLAFVNLCPAGLHLLGILLIRRLARFQGLPGSGGIGALGLQGQQAFLQGGKLLCRFRGNSA